MIQKLPQSSGNVVGFAARGSFSREDYQVIDSEVKLLLEQYNSVNLLFNAEEMAGVDLTALDSDLRMMQFMGDVAHAAVVSDSRFYEWMLPVADAVMDSEMRHFEPGQEAQAWAWLKYRTGITFQWVPR